MILDLFIYIIQFYINQNTFLPGFIIRKAVEGLILPLRLTILLIPIEPFAYNMGYHTCYDRDNNG